MKLLKAAARQMQVLLAITLLLTVGAALPKLQSIGAAVRAASVAGDVLWALPLLIKHRERAAAAFSTSPVAVAMYRAGKGLATSFAKRCAGGTTKE